VFDPQVTAVGAEGKSTYPPVSVRLEQTTAQNVLEAILNNYDLRLERDPKTKISRVSVKSKDAPEPLVTKIYPLKFVNPSNLVAIIKPTMGGRSIAIPDGRSSQLVVFATEKELPEIESLIAKLDISTKQVLIEARILETSRNPATIKGVNWAGTFAAQNIYIGNNDGRNLPIAPGIAPSLLAFLRAGYLSPVAYLNADGASAVFSFFNTDTETEILATPRAVTMDNMPAKLSVSRAVPIFKVSQGGTQVGTAVDIVYTNLGVILEVTPRISGGTNVALQVIPEVSGIAGLDSQTIDGKEYTANIFSIRKISTQVLIPSGNTLVLGGLLSDSKSKERTKVPILGDLPGLKYVFGHTSKSRTKANLMIFVTPTVVADSNFQPTESNYLKTPVPKDPSPTDVGSFDKPWDGVEPYDWGKAQY
jgi:general secretion pathway protein D